jgi:GNAT superfamily N-acetyltransferase
LSKVDVQNDLTPREQRLWEAVYAFGVRFPDHNVWTEYDLEDCASTTLCMEVIVSQGLASFMLSVTKNEVYLESVHVEPEFRGAGLGRRMLTRICKWADKAGIRLYLYVGPFDGSPMTISLTADWYRRFGFRRCPTKGKRVRYMTRKPR